MKGLSPLKPTNIVKENIQPFVNAGSKDANGNYRKKKGTKHTAIERSKTFEGIARAMAEQWAGKNVLHPYSTLSHLHRLYPCL